MLYRGEMGMGVKVVRVKAAAPSNGTNRPILRESNPHSQT